MLWRTITDPADLRDAARGRLPVLHDLLRGGRAARFSRHSLPVESPLGDLFRHPRRYLAVDAVLLPRAAGRAPGRARRSGRERTSSTRSRAGRSSGTCSLPHLQPTIVIVLLLRLAESLKLFDIPFALTGGGPGIATQSYSLLAYRTGLRYFDIGYASAMAYGLLIFVMIIITVFFRRVRNTYA